MKTPKDLECLNPCQKGLTYARQFNTLQEAWDKCEDSLWMWWFLCKRNVSKEISAKFARLCANHVKHLNNKYSDVAANYAAAAIAEYKWQADKQIT